MIERLAQLRPKQHLWLLIGVATLLRILFAQTGYGLDESYAVATAREFHLSGYDHPPMAWWLAGIMQHLFDSNAWIVRLPFIALSAVATWQIYRLTAFIYDKRTGIFAALIFTLAPALGVTDGAWVLPDGPLLVGLLGGVYHLVLLIHRPKEGAKHWLLAGLWGGLAMLAKYHGVFLFIGALGFVITQREQRHWLRTPWPYLGALLGLYIFSPVIWWNFAHDFASFAFQSGRTGAVHIQPLRPFIMLAGQAAFLAPWIWLGLVVATRDSLKREVRKPERALLLWIGLPIIFLFTVPAIIASGQMLFHWAMPGYLMLVPLFADWLARRAESRPRWVHNWIKATAGVILTLLTIFMLLWYAPATLKSLGMPADPLADMRPMPELIEYLDSNNFLKRDNLVVAPTKWHRAGQIDIALDGRLPVTCFCADARQYGILAPLSSFAGKDFLVLVALKHANDGQQSYAQWFSAFSRLEDVVLPQGRMAVFYGKRLKPDAKPD